MKPFFELSECFKMFFVLFQVRESKKKMSMLFMKFKNSSQNVLTSKKHEVSTIASNVYSDPSVMKLLILKTKDHISSFKNVMRNFDIEMVIIGLTFY
jgi:hypothetical protein